MKIKTSKSRLLTKLVISALAAVPAAAAVGSTEASALYNLQAPASLTCGNRMLMVSPPRAWSSYSTPEQVLWANIVERYNPTTGQWYVYNIFQHFSSFNNRGSSPTSWSMYNNTKGGMYINSRLNLPVSHAGYYRVRSIFGNDSAQTDTYVAGGNWCLFA